MIPTTQHNIFTVQKSLERKMQLCFRLHIAWQHLCDMVYHYITFLCLFEDPVEVYTYFNRQVGISMNFSATLAIYLFTLYFRLCSPYWHTFFKKNISTSGKLWTCFSSRLLVKTQLPGYPCSPLHSCMVYERPYVHFNLHQLISRAIIYFSLHFQMNLLFFKS